MYKAENPEARNMPEVLYYIGYGCLIQGDFEQAMTYFNEILKDFPNSEYVNAAKKYIDRIKASVQ